jgi:glycine betaine/proline transport system ATP-binding protein|tara:strand:- start:5 stop:1078 length:1074 start_codon:yes stop_codon:yes gene_type:complete
LSAEITLKNLSKQFPGQKRAAVQDVSLTIEPGEIFVVMGLSGSGKSTLLRMMNGLIKPSAGSVEVRGQLLTDLSTNQLNTLRRQCMAMVFQSFALFPQRSVLDNAAFGLEVSGLPKAKRYAQAQRALERVGLGNQLNRKPAQLSGGMQQRVGLARALALDPPILLMDEAFSALDPLIRKDMQDLLLELQAEQRRTVVFISHDRDEAIRIGDRIALMQAGAILQCSTAQDLVSAPANAEVEAFFETVDRGSVLTLGQIVEPFPDTVVLGPGDVPQNSEEQPFQLVVDQNGGFLGLITHDHGWIQADKASPLDSRLLVNQAIDPISRTRWPIAVLDAHRRPLGMITPQRILEVLRHSQH